MAQGNGEGELEHTTRRGSRIVVASRWAVKDEMISPQIMEISRDMTERKALLTKLELQARQDYLTGLNNRISWRPQNGNKSLALWS